NQHLHIDAQGGVLANDTDADGDSLTVVAGTVATSAGAQVVLSADGAFHYRPKPGFTGTDTFSYTVTDGDLDDTATVSITVEAPVIWWVDGAAAAGGDGTDEEPFQSLDALDPA